MDAGDAETLTKYDRGGGTKYDFVKPMGESHTVVLFMAELMYEFEAEIARREKSAASR